MKFTAIILLVICLSLTSFKQDEPQELQVKTLNFFANNLDQLARLSPDILKLFKEQGRNTIFYFHGFEKTKLANYSIYSYRYWKTYSGPTVDSLVVDRYVLADKDPIKPKPFDVNIVIFKPVIDSGFYYVECRFWSIGPYKDKYLGEI